MRNSDATEDELPLASRKKTKKKKRGLKKAPVKRIRKKQVRNLPAEKPIECPDCGLRFYWMSTLKVHQKQHTGEKPYQCNVCKKCFRKPYSLKTHKYIHSDEKPFQCNFCPYACRDSSTLRKHHYRHMGIVQKYNCKMCSKTFSRKYVLKNHVAEAHLNVNLRTHRCETCGKLFKSQKQATLHKRLVHERARATTCPICNKYLSNSSNLKTHLVSHVQERPYMCDFPGCDKRYKDKGSLQKHSKVHRPDKQFSCTVCGYMFTRPERLRNHMIKVHQRSKCVECDYCGQKFYSKNYLIIHIGKKHDENREQYICDMCGFKANNKPGMVMHVKYGHDGIRNDVHCNLCRKTYKKHEYLKMHYQRTHNIAYKTFKNQRQKLEAVEGSVKIKTEPVDSEDEPLNDIQIQINQSTDQAGKIGQIKMHDATERTGKQRRCNTSTKRTPSKPPPKLFKCDICGRFFKRMPRLKNHLVKVHGRSKCVSCEICGQKFYSKNYLIDHMYKRHVNNKEYVCDECGFKTHHKPGIAVHIKFAHTQPAVQCEICKKKYKRLELLQFHYSEAHNTSYKIMTNRQHSTIKDVKVKMEPLMEVDGIDLLEIEKHELIPDRSLTRDGTTTLKGLIERSGVRSVPEGVFEEFCSGHITYLPAGVNMDRGPGKPPECHLGYTDKKLEAQASSNINKLVSDARRKRAVEKLERARQMYNHRMKCILEAKSKTSKFQRPKGNNEKPKENKDDKANEEDGKANSDIENNLSGDEQVTIVDNSDASNKSNDDTHDDIGSDATNVSDDNTETNNTQMKGDGTNGDKESLLTLLKELDQLTAKPDSSNIKAIVLEGKETTAEDILTCGLAENYSNDELDESDENYKRDDEIGNDASKYKVNELESNTEELINSPNSVEDSANKSSETNQVRSDENASATKTTKVLSNDHDYAKSERTRQIELKLLQCPESLFDKSYDTSEEERQNNLEKECQDFKISDNVTLLDAGRKYGKSRRKQKIKLRGDIGVSSPEKQNQKTVKKKPIRKTNKDILHENCDSTTPLVFDVPRRKSERRRKQKLKNRDRNADYEEELPLIFMTRKIDTKNDGNCDKVQPKDDILSNNKLKEKTNDELSVNITVKEENASDNELNEKTPNEIANNRSMLQFKYKVLVEEVLRSFNENQELNGEDLCEEITNDNIQMSGLNKDFIELVKLTRQATPNEKQILTDKLNDIAKTKPSNYSNLVEEVLKSIDELVSENQSNTTEVNAVNSEDTAPNSEDVSYLTQRKTSQANTKHNEHDASQSKDTSTSNIKITEETTNVINKRKRVKPRRYFDNTDDIVNHNAFSEHSSQNTKQNDNTTNVSNNSRKKHAKAKKTRKRKFPDAQNDSNKSNKKQKLHNDNTDGANNKEEITLKRSSRKRILNRKYKDDSNDDESNEASNIKKDSKKSSGKIIFNTHQCYVCFKVFETKEALVDHCKSHFGVDRQKSLKKCPLCEFTCTKGFSRHMKKIHDVSIKIPYARIQEELDGECLKYYFKINDPNIKRVEVIPSVKNLNRRAMIEIDKKKREKDAKVIAKHKLVRKGNEWIVEKEELNLDNVVMPKFDKNIDISDKICDTDDYFDSLKKLYHVSKKAGKKMMFPCQHCDKICQNLAALKLHNRKHETNPAPFAPKVWKHKLDNPECSSKRKVAKSKKAKSGKVRTTKKAAATKIETVNKTNVEDMLHSQDKRKAKPKPIKNKHRCDPQLQEFYKNNVRGGNIEFWQFLKIFNKMDRDNIKDFKDLEGKYDYGIVDADLQKEILEENYVLQVGDCNGESIASNTIDRDDENIAEDATIDERQDEGKDKNETCTVKLNPNKNVKSKTEKKRIVKKFSKNERKKRAREIAHEIMQHSLQ